MWKQSGVPGGVQTKNKPEGHECIPSQGPASRHCFLENACKRARLKCWNVCTKAEKNKKYCGGPLLLPSVMVTNCANNLLVLKMSCHVKRGAIFFFSYLPFILISFPRQCPETTPSSVEVNVMLIYVYAGRQPTNQQSNRHAYRRTNHPAKPS